MLTMAKLVIVVLSTLIAAIVSAQMVPTCKLNQAEIQKDIMECVTEQPNMLLQVMGRMSKLESLATSEFICRNQVGVVGILLCLEDKFASCFPSAKEAMMEILPNRSRWQDAIKFMCDHKTELLDSNCIDQSQLQEFTQCYMGKLMTTVQTMRANHNVKAAVCSVIRSEEQCINTYHGTCSQTYVDLLFQLLEILMPFCPVQAIDVKNQAMRDAFGSILLRGQPQPLRFQPKESVKYNVVDG